MEETSSQSIEASNRLFNIPSNVDPCDEATDCPVDCSLTSNLKPVTDFPTTIRSLNKVTQQINTSSFYQYQYHIYTYIIVCFACGLVGVAAAQLELVVAQLQK